MSKKKKTVDLAQSQQIEEKVEQLQEVSDTSETIVEETSKVLDEVVEEIPTTSENSSKDLLANTSEISETIKDDNSNASEIEEVSDCKELDEKIDSSSKEDSNHFEEKADKKNSRKMWIILSICLFFIMLLFLLFSTVFALVYGAKSTIIQGVSIKDIDVSSLTKQEALEKVLSTFQEKLEQPITLTHNEYETTVFSEQFDVAFALEEAVNMAYGKGRTRKYFSK